jgi:hypothetical protein
MACENQVGVRNIWMTFTDCDTGTVYGPFAHDLAGDEQPMYRLCPFSNEAMPNGYVKRNVSNSKIGLNIVRHQGVPLQMYQGCAAVNVNIEHYNGRIVTALNGTPIGDDDSDGHEVSMDITFAEVDEYLPSPATAATT